MLDNRKHAVTSGGYGHAPTKHAESNIFVANRASGSGESAFFIQHGAVQSDFWVSNLCEGLSAPSGMVNCDPQSSANVSVLIP